MNDKQSIYDDLNLDTEQVSSNECWNVDELENGEPVAQNDCETPKEER